MGEQMKNLDQAAMLCANAILKSGDREKLETVATKGLGVVTEQGIYAGLLFLYTKGDPKFAEQLMQMANDVVPGAPNADDRIGCLGYLAEKVCVDLHSTLLVKMLWEQTMTYVRYGAKALESKS